MNVPDPRDRAAERTDWERLRSRLDRAQEALQHRLNPTPEAQQQILRERARLLAQPRRDDIPASESLEVVQFDLSGEWYALETRYVREIAPLRDWTPLPGAPSFVVGVINLRGEILSVIDLKKFFELPERGLSDVNKVIVLQSPAMEFGVLADAIAGTRSIETSGLTASLPSLTGVRSEFLRGITREAVVVLDAAKLLESPSVVVDDGAPQR